MPRIARKELETNYFHVITQGINKEYIFDNRNCKNKYKKLLLSNLEKYEVKILSYCIMDNHAHILIYCDEILEMSKYMKSVNTSYAKFYNYIKNRVGFVFRNRFETEPIYDKKYLLNCIGYIHNNPVKAKIVKEPEDYEFSSYCDYIKKEGIANDATIELCFDSSINYLEQYLIIHKNKEVFRDCDREIEYKKFLNKIKRMNIEEIKQDDNKLKELLKIAVNIEKVPIKELARVLELDRFRIYRALKK